MSAWVLRFRTWASLGALIVSVTLLAQSPSAQPGFGVCKPVSQRTSEEGCWILADQPVGTMRESRIYWHLDQYATRAQAEQAKGPRGTVVESFHKFWLLTIEKAGWRPARRGQRIAEIGPIAVTPGNAYSALFMEAITNPGWKSAIHRHSGAEAWYTMAGNTCLETSAGKFVGRKGGTPVIVPADTPMLLTAIGKEQRRALTLILHDSSLPPTTMEHHWKPKGLCRGRVTRAASTNEQGRRELLAETANCGYSEFSNFGVAASKRVCAQRMKSAHLR